MQVHHLVATEVRRLDAAATEQPHRILVVDDDEDIGSALVELLAAYGHEAIAARSGPEALEVAATFDPDLVLTDLGMPGMDGYAVAREFRLRYGERSFVVAVSGYAPKASLLKDVGFDGHMIKPPDVEAIVAWLAERGAQRSSQRRDARTVAPPR